MRTSTGRLYLARTRRAALPSLGGVLIVAGVIVGNYWNMLTSEPAQEAPAVAMRLARLQADEARYTDGDASGAALGVRPGGPVGESLPGAPPTIGQGLPPQSATITKGETLGHALERLNVPRKDASAVVSAFSQRRDPRNIRVGDSVRAFYDASGAVQKLVVASSGGAEAVTVRRSSEAGSDAAFVAEAGGEAGDLTIAEVSCAIAGALPAALARCGEDPSLAVVVAPVLSWSLDLYTDLQSGDELRAVVEKFVDGERFVRYGRLLALQYRTENKNFRAFRFRLADGREGFFDEQGRSVERAFLRSPLKAARVSSGYSHTRMHPILHKVQAHLGVDYAAPVGTPVWTVADGTVTAVGRAGPAGNRVIIKHDHGLTTEYLHLSRFASGLKAGKRVEQGSTIGYVGTTGRSTGPHLHFSARKNGEFFNPTRLLEGNGPGLPRAQHLEGADLSALHAAIAPYLDRFERKGTPPQVGRNRKS
jgi:murein DD-endopeptidase MepM/ murein hydrolase activator NlpD